MNEEFLIHHLCNRIEEDYRILAMEHHVCRGCHTEAVNPEDSTFIVNVMLSPDNTLLDVNLQELVANVLNFFDKGILVKRCEIKERNSEHEVFITIQQMPKILLILIKRYCYDKKT